MTDLRRGILALLADGEWHSGAALAAALGCTRAAVWKHMAALRAMGLCIHAARSRGYALDRPVELLSAVNIRSQLDSSTRSALTRLDVLFTTESTSSLLAGRPAPVAGCMEACGAEFQTTGRGRRGRRWYSPLARGLCLSVGWQLPLTPPTLSAAGLAAGVAVLEALETAGVPGVRLKWPNDLVGAGAKLGGILVDVAGESGGPLQLIVGVGINVQGIPAVGIPDPVPGALAAASVEQLAGVPVSRNHLAALILMALHRSLLEFQHRGFAPFAERWRARDWLRDRPVVVSGASTLHGIARGITADGALLVESAGRILPVVAGDVSVRREGG